MVRESVLYALLPSQLLFIIYHKFKTVLGAQIFGHNATTTNALLEGQAVRISM